MCCSFYSVALLSKSPIYTPVICFFFKKKYVSVSKVGTIHFAGFSFLMLMRYTMHYIALCTSCFLCLIELHYADNIESRLEIMRNASWPTSGAHFQEKKSTYSIRLGLITSRVHRFRIWLPFGYWCNHVMGLLVVLALT